MKTRNLRQLLAEVIPLATQRAGGIAWEYLFRFDGGVPPWTSGLSQGTALQVLARAWSRFKEPAYLAAAQQALGVFEHSPSQGVRVATPAGALYAEYTYAPSDRILNGFIQALVGLYDYTAITGDPLGLALFNAGDAEARAEVPHYDTGGWSLYDQFGESNLNYHELLTEFLQHLCERTRRGEPAPAACAGHGAASGARHDHAGARGGRYGGRERRRPQRAGRGGHADRGRSGLLLHGPALHGGPDHAAGDRAAHQHPARRHARRRAALALEALHRGADDPPGLARGVAEHRDSRRRPPAAAVGDAVQGRDVLGVADGHGPGRQLRNGRGDDRGRRPLALERS